jgi:Icc protein
MLGPMRIVHLADFHLPAAPNKLLHGVNPYVNLASAVAVIRKQVPVPDLVVLGGDLLEDGEHSSYQAVLDLFKDLQVPVHAVLGNHDSLAGFRKTAQPPRGPEFPGYYSFDLKGVHFVMLFSACTGKEFGRLEERQLLWLNEDLHRNSQKPVLIFLHPSTRASAGWTSSSWLTPRASGKSSRPMPATSRACSPRTCTCSTPACTGACWPPAARR